jgi:hypothetical protein
MTKDLSLGAPQLTQNWLSRVWNILGKGEGPRPIQGYAKATLPTASKHGDTSSFSSIIYVTDEAGGAVLAFSDGTNWRRVTDRAVVS